MDMDFVDEFDVEEESEEGAERQNRTFIILVGVMSALLLVGIVAFCAWALSFGGGILDGEGQAAATNTPMGVAGDLTVTVTMTTTVASEEPSATPSPEPTETPTRTPRPSPTSSPAVSPTPTGTPEAVAEVTSTATPTPMRTLVTQEAGGSDSPPDTGIGAFTALVVAGGLVILLVTARRLRAVR